MFSKTKVPTSDSRPERRVEAEIVNRGETLFPS